MEYKEKCHTHGQDALLMCPECMTFRCVLCEDPHAKLISGGLIDKYIRELAAVSANNQDLINIKQTLITTYQQIDASLKKAFEDAILYIDSLAIPSNKAINAIKEMNLSDKALQMLKSISKKSIQSADIENKRNQNIGKEMYSQVSAIVNSMSELKTQLIQLVKTPLSAFDITEIYYFKNGENSISCFNIESQSINSIQVAKAVNMGSEGILVDNNLFIMGGYPCTNDVYKLDMALKSMIQKTPMLMKKCIFSLCHSYSDIYSIGGYNNDSSILADCEKYSIHGNKWSKLPNMQTSRCLCASLCFNNKDVYVIGGYNSSKITNVIEKLNISKAQTWEICKISNSMDSVRYAQAIQTCDNEILVFGDGCYNLRIGSLIDCVNIKMEWSGRFYSTMAPILKGKYTYCIDDKRNIHIYSEGKWTLIKNNGDNAKNIDIPIKTLYKTFTRLTYCGGSWNIGPTEWDAIELKIKKSMSLCGFSAYSFEKDGMKSWMIYKVKVNGVLIREEKIVFGYSPDNMIKVEFGLISQIRVNAGDTLTLMQSIVDDNCCVLYGNSGVESNEYFAISKSSDDNNGNDSTHGQFPEIYYNE